MIVCPECNGDKVIEVQKDASLYSSHPHFETVVCPGCEGEGEIETWEDVARQLQAENAKLKAEIKRLTELQF